VKLGIYHNDWGQIERLYSITGLEMSDAMDVGFRIALPDLQLNTRITQVKCLEKDNWREWSRICANKDKSQIAKALAM
jgi:hypothetical protein